MNITRSQTDILRELSRLFAHLNEQIQAEIDPTIHKCTDQLEGDWEGVSRRSYDQLYHEWRLAADRVVTLGEDLERHLQETVTRFEHAARH